MGRFLPNGTKLRPKLTLIHKFCNDLGLEIFVMNRSSKKSPLTSLGLKLLTMNLSKNPKIAFESSIKFEHRMLSKNIAD